MKNLIKAMILLLPVAASAQVDPGLSAALERLDIRTEPALLSPAPVPGFLEVSKGAKLLYISSDGELLIDGDIISMSSAANLSEQRRATIRLRLVQSIPTSDRIVFPSSGPTRERLTVFTDTNCRYCLQFHRKLQEYSRQGIEVQYLFYPRSGPSGESFDQAIAVWCAADRAVALDTVFGEEHLPSKQCDNPVMRHYQLATDLGLKGTPAIITADGTVHYGLADLDKILGISSR